jgi:hypothetical protein
MDEEVRREFDEVYRQLDVLMDEVFKRRIDEERKA